MKRIMKLGSYQRMFIKEHDRMVMLFFVQERSVYHDEYKKCYRNQKSD